MKNLKFIKGTVAIVIDKHENHGVDLLLTPKDIKELSTKNGYLPISIRVDTHGDPYAYKSTHRLAPSKPNLDAVSEALHMEEYKQGKKETVHINEIVNKVNKEWKSR